MPRKGIDNKPQKGLMTMKIVHLHDSSLNSPPCESPPSPFNWIQWMNYCDKPWVGKLFVMHCMRWLKVVIIMYCGYVMCIRLNLVSPSSRVVSFEA